MYSISAADLKREIENANCSDEELRKRMGVGFSHLDTLFSGGKVDGWGALFVESALSRGAPSSH